MQALFDPWLDAAIGADVLRASHAGAQALAARRAVRLTALLRAATDGSPLYGRLLRQRDPERVQLQDLPVAHKRELMRDFDAWVADPKLRLPALRRFLADPSLIGEPYLGRYTVWESSGSGGEPGVFVQDMQAMAVYDVLEALRRRPRDIFRQWLDPLGLGECIVFVGATGGHFASTVSVERLRRLSPLLASELHSVSFLQPPAGIVAQLNELRPTVLATYPSAAAMLAQQQLAGHLQIQPREVWTGGETLSPAVRRFVERAFACSLANSYGASEFLTLAFECEHGRLHLNSDWAILESVDEQGRPVPAGQAGATCLLTNLANHVQPLIRYDLGDRVSLHAEPCACGSSLPVIEVQGRHDDTLIIERAGHDPVRLLPLALCTVLEDDAQLFDFQLLQQGPRELLLRTGFPGPAGERALRRGRCALNAFLAQQGLHGVHVECRCGEDCRHGRSGKTQRIVGLAGRARQHGRASTAHETLGELGS